MATEIQNVVAHRSLDRTHPDGTNTKIDVYIGDVSVVPADSADSSDCGQAWLEIKGADISFLKRVYGADTMQAVYLAMWLAGRELDDLDHVGEIEADENEGEGYRGVTQFGFPLWPMKEEEGQE